MTKKVIVHLKGGMGNQMFQYAAGKCLAIKNQCELKMNVSAYTPQPFFPFFRDSLREYELGVFSFPQEFATAGECNDFGKKPWLGFFSGSRHFVEETGLAFHPDIIRKYDGSVMLSGYWQSEKYFKEVEGEIRNDFRFLQMPAGKALVISREISACPSVSVHIRRGDYISSPHVKEVLGTPEQGYFQKALEFIHSKVSHPRFFVFSDDISWVKENEKQLSTATFVSDENLTAGEEMQLMAMCQHHILSNSTFGWWGAWLSQSPSKTVVGPARWFSNPQFSNPDLLPDTWVKL